MRKFASLCDCKDSHYTDCFIVSTYLRQNNICVKRNRLILDHLVDNDNITRFAAYLECKRIKLSLEDLIAFFEFVISPQEKQVNGAVYTPEYIREGIVRHVLQQVEGELDQKKYADIACGCGGFLITLARYLHKTGIIYKNIFKDCLYGYDIAEYSIKRTELLLTLLALEEEDVEAYDFNLIQADTLSYNWMETDVINNHGGYDIIIGNPPYVGASKIDEKSLAFVKKWEVSKTGKADMYIPFFQIAIELLNDRGILGYITVSNFYRSLNGKALRQYFVEHQLNLTIVDFGNEQVFKGCSTYTCLCFVNKRQGGTVRYVETISKAIEEMNKLHFIEVAYEDLDSSKGWVIKDNRIKDILQRIEITGKPLGSVVSVSNGLATLKNDIYVLNVVEEDVHNFIHEYNGNRYPIERDICRLVVKPSAMDVNKPVAEQTRWIIFPYEIKGRKVFCYDGNKMREQYPHAYSYLQAVKPILDKRDKGKRKYEQWFAYGRSQAINMPGFRLLMPYIADAPTFMLSDNDGLLYYNGFAIVSNDLQQLERLKKILNTDIFWFYVKNISKPYANGYYSMGKRYIRYFGIPDFSEEQLNELDALTKKEDIEEFLNICYFGDDADRKREIITSYI